MNVLSLFSGIGAFEKALKNEGIPFDLVGYCEIDKYASKAYSLIHNVPEEMNIGDITKVDTSKIGEVDLITYGFPCQDISVAGKQKGFSDENGERTRSGLFFEALRIIEDTQPKFAICENVKALTSKKFEKEFATVLESLDAAGYNNYWQVLNAKNYGVPQNRERVFVISIRKDIDKGFTFPTPFPLEKRLKDVLENEVDEKYYLSKEVQDRFQHSGNPQAGRIYEPNVLTPKRTEYGKAIRKQYEAGEIEESRHNMTKMVPRTDGIANTLTTVLKDNYAAEPQKKRQVRGFVKGE